MKNDKRCMMCLCSQGVGSCFVVVVVGAESQTVFTPILPLTFIRKILVVQSHRQNIKIFSELISKNSGKILNVLKRSPAKKQ
jgi:hypothetical protein